MLRTITILAAGALFGGAFVLVTLEDGDSVSAPGSASPSFLVNVAGFMAGRNGAEAHETLSLSETLAVYQAAAAATDSAGLAASLERLAALPWLPARDVEIDALLVRLADLDSAYAARLARGLALETHFVAEAYVHWARDDPLAAIGELSSIENPARRLDIAMALLDVFGNDASGLERVAAGLSASQRDSLIVESITARAEQEPYAAFRDAQALNDTSLKSRALQRIGATWAMQDPRGAMAQAGQLPTEMQSAYRAGVINEWARLDGADFLAWLASTPSPPAEVVVGIEWLAGSNADLVMSIADGMTGDIGRTMKFAVLSALAESDPEAAMARADALPPGSDRETMLMSVASVIARSDPDTALAWARRMSPPARNLMSQITIAIIQRDPTRAVEFMENPPEGVDPQLVSAVLGSVLTSDSDGAARLADTLVASDSIQAANALRSVIGNWMELDPERAFEWVLANDAALDAGMIAPAAQVLARVDPVAAAGYVTRIPAEYRSAWITQVAGPYGLQDLNGALAWIAQFQGQDVYQSALRQAVVASAQVDARNAAQVLSRSSGEVQLGASAQVAQALAQQDPRAAVRWAVSLSEPRAQRNAISASISVWAARDLSSARNFTLGMERGESRDQALSVMVSRLGQSGEFDRSLYDAFSSDNARQEALITAIPMIARTDREQADDLLRLVTSGNSRSRIEQQISALE